MHEGEARSLFMAYHLEVITISVEILKLSPHGLRGSSHRRFVFCKIQGTCLCDVDYGSVVGVEDWEYNKIIICNREI
ncbi:uncharacterized protein LOC131318469 isoform X4 [Rhododendron vialii]|uniref:uncharacterized protein LOC131318469 isoform X4 n=1 Tax=Rhododendron vialii TaxID=182163 RepID=UPI00265FEFED|nr:uncharacterized protein LOC131318469 isoform X4 [Rhododendron vialii]